MTSDDATARASRTPTTAEPAAAPAPVLAALAALARLVSAPADGPGRKKPPTLSYGAEERPPAAVTWISGVQHVGVVAIFMVYPLIMARQADWTSDQVTNMLQLGMLVLAAAVVLQALPRGPVGSRYLAPSIFTGVYLAPSMLAFKAGGLPLVWGMTMFAGAVEIVLSRFWARLRPFIPPESAGLVVFLVGVIIGLAALRVLLDGNPSPTVTAPDALVAASSLAVMASLNIWNRGRLKLFCILIGMMAGYMASGLVGLLTWNDLAAALHRPLFAVPSVAHISWSFDWELVIPFAVTGLAAAMSATAVVTTYQRLTDADWVRPDMTSVSRGIFADGLSAILSGLAGTFGLTISTANVGLVAATGVASRVIAFAAAALLALVALQPALVGVLSIMPRPVMASALLFTSAFIMIGGVQIISTRVLDGRRTLVVGMGLMAFIMVSVHPTAFTGVPAWAQPLVTSPLVLATLVALSLNLVFRLGIRRKVYTTVDPRSADLRDITGFIERCAGMWGARRDVVNRLEFAVQQSVEAVIEFCGIDGRLGLEIGFDEFVIDAVITYNGAPLEFPDQPPTKDEILESEDGARRLAGFLVKRHADRIDASRIAGGTVIRLHFDH